MAAIHLTDRGTAVRVRPEARALAQAAVAALPAPSIFSSQPWRWRISDDHAELYADRVRKPPAEDPDGRLLTISCGIALHHALTALAARGSCVQVARLPDATKPDLLAIVRLTGSGNPDPAAARLHAAMTPRDPRRRQAGGGQVPAEKLARLHETAEAGGAHLHLLRSDQAASVIAAAGTSAPDPADREARYAVLYTDGDGPIDWLVAGEAVSAVLLTAASEGVTAAPMTDVAAVPAARRVLRDMLAGIGHPVLTIRLGPPLRSAASGPV